MPGYFLALPGFVDPTVAIALFRAQEVWGGLSIDVCKKQISNVTPQQVKEHDGR
jgi:hypothetical protein